ncbi:MAG: hypothetical protein RMM08_04225 [Armatimonadota bacterium]|nr:hypothetical protein [bacterium]MDW8320551.1 hypothetical protein [Armatimonadota bacterium]
MAYRGAQKTSFSRSKKRHKSAAVVAGRWMLVGVACLIGFKLVLSFGEQVMTLAQAVREQRQDIAALRVERERLMQQNAALREEIHRLNTPSGIILEARKQGYGFPGERLLVLEPLAGQTN